MAARTAKTYRLSAETLEELRGVAEAEGVSEAQALERCVHAYVHERTRSYTPTDREETGREEGPDAGLIDALRGEVADLRARLDTAAAQMSAALEQNAAVARVAEQAQQLQALEAARRPGVAERVRRLFGRG